MGALVKLFCEAATLKSVADLNIALVVAPILWLIVKTVLSPTVSDLTWCRAS